MRDGPQMVARQRSGVIIDPRPSLIIVCPLRAILWLTLSTQEAVKWPPIPRRRECSITQSLPVKQRFSRKQTAKGATFHEFNEIGSSSEAANHIRRQAPWATIDRQAGSLDLGPGDERLGILLGPLVHKMHGLG